MKRLRYQMACRLLIDGQWSISDLLISDLMICGKPLVMSY